MKKAIPYIIIIALIVGFLGAIGYLKINSDSKNNQGQNQAKTTETEPYFDNSAAVMYFYSPNCSHCQEEKSVLTDLSNDGYRVKPMNVLDHPDYAKQYNIEGTPTFISQKGGAKLVGFQDRTTLKAWLDQHK